MTLGILADWASLLGLAISIVGFLATFRAARRAEEAAREAVDRVGRRLFADDVGLCLRLVQECREADRGRSWHRAVDRCAEARIRAAKLSAHPRLDEAERRDLLKYVDDLRQTLVKLEKMAASSEPSGLGDQARRRLDEIASFLSAIDGRIQAEALEL